jgi:hypothetical protein
MKKSIYHLLMVIIASIVMVACSKDVLEHIDDFTMGYGPGYSPGVPKDRKIKVLEYGSQIELRDAQLTINGLGSPLDSPTKIYFYGTRLTDSVGEIHLKSYEIPNIGGYYYSISKEKYWTNGGTGVDSSNPFHALVDYFEPDTIFYLAGLDSLVVSLFPNSWLKIHLKNINAYASSDSIRLYANILKKGSYFGSTNNILNFGVPPLPANNTDTTITVRTKGNVENQLIIDMANGIPRNIIFTETRFVNRGDTLEWELLY